MATPEFVLFFFNVVPYYVTCALFDQHLEFKGHLKLALGHMALVLMYY